MAITGRPRGFDRTEALDHALMAFWEKGYEATSMTDLVAVMGINSPSIYAAYRSKEALFTDAVDHYRLHYAAVLVTALNDPPAAAAGLTAMFDAAIALFTRHGRPHGCFIVSAVAGNAPASFDVQRKLALLRQERTTEIAARLNRDVAEGRLSADVPVKSLADMYAAILQGMAAAARDGVSPARLSALYRSSIRLLNEER